MRSWLSHNYIQATRKIKIKNADIPVTLENEVIPTRKQLDQVMASASPRTRTIICIMAFAGVRPQVLVVLQLLIFPVLSSNALLIHQGGLFQSFSDILPGFVTALITASTNFSWYGVGGISSFVAG
ncbi:MAG: hypothetical protein IS860_07415 [Nitrosopumilus sp.]|nr:hypothetical protein [Nitrosopumilus sp.]